ncbi:hypothetical protein AAHA92_07465 [Salvia divinorum]|uniref:Uncharacterized protein n=1 Tax=Salvia divinorum TaxID=28513 RepID=A0ABD1I935_SALDI
MIKEEEKDGASGGSWRTYSRSVSWTERPPRASTSSTTSKPQWNSKARSCLPPLQPLSIIRPSVEEWPRAGSDDLGEWSNNPPTPGGKPRGSVTPRESSNSDQPPREFEFRKDKLAFFNKECSRILDHIYLGSDAIAKNREILRQNGITHVLNCVGFVCPEYFKNELVYKTLWLQDCPSEDITSADKLDSRGAFVIQIPSALYVWTGKHCPAMMLDNVRATTSQVIRYERARGPIITIKEGEETFEFWDALTYSKSSTDGCEAKSEEEKSLSSGSHLRKLAEYDLDFEIFNGALAGGVVPPLSGSETETCLPARETGWNRFRRKFASGIVKELITSSKLISCKFAKPICEGMLPVDMSKEVDDFVPPANASTSAGDLCDLPDSLSPYVTRSPQCSKNNLTEEAFPATLSDCSLSRSSSPSFSLVESFSSFHVNKMKSSSMSPSLAPSSSNSCDLSHVSSRPSLTGLECIDFDPSKSPLSGETIGSADGESTYLVDNAPSPLEKVANSANPTLRVEGSSPTCKNRILVQMLELRYSILSYLFVIEKIVKEGEEPVELLGHVSHLSLNNDADDGN